MRHGAGGGSSGGGGGQSVTRGLYKQPEPSLKKKKNRSAEGLPFGRVVVIQRG